jgi:hypothetical protein
MTCSASGLIAEQRLNDDVQPAVFRAIPVVLSVLLSYWQGKVAKVASFFSIT